MDEERVKWSKILLVDKSDGSSTSRDRHPTILCILLSYFFLLFSCSFVLDGGQRERGCMEKRTDVREKRQIYIYMCIYSVVGRRRFRILDSKYRCRELWIVLEKFVLKEENLKFDIWSSRSNVYVYVFEQRENTRFEMRKRGNKKWRVGNVDFFIFLEQRC